MTSYDIKSLIPQREPILLVDALVGVEGGAVRTRLTVRRDNCFVGEDGLLAEPGLVEHIAQSASAFAGYKAMEARASEPPVGYRRSEEVSVLSLPPGGRGTTDHGDFRPGSGRCVRTDGRDLRRGRNGGLYANEDLCG